MFWEDVEKMYGKSMADKMAESEQLCCVTVVMRDGKADIPEIDIENAYKDITGQYIHPYAWD